MCDSLILYFIFLYVHTIYDTLFTVSVLFVDCSLSLCYDFIVYFNLHLTVYCTVLYYIVYYAVLYYILYCTVLYYIVYYAVLYYILYCTVLYYILYYAVLYCTLLYCAAL